MVDLLPYRKPGEIVQYQPQNTYGLLRKPKPPKPPKPHQCSPPGIIMRWLCAIIGRSIPLGSLYRCQSCNTISTLRKGAYIGTFFSGWEPANLRGNSGAVDWKEFGGKYEYEEDKD